MILYVNDESYTYYDWKAYANLKNTNMHDLIFSAKKRNFQYKSMEISVSVDFCVTEDTNTRNGLPFFTITGCSDHNRTSL